MFLIPDLPFGRDSSFTTTLNSWIPGDSFENSTRLYIILTPSPLLPQNPKTSRDPLPRDPDRDWRDIYTTSCRAYPGCGFSHKYC